MGFSNKFKTYYKQFFEEDVNNAIMNIAKEHTTLSNFSDEDTKEYINNSKVVIEFGDYDNDSIHYKFGYDPFVKVWLAPDNYVIVIMDQMSKLSDFRTSEYNSFVRYWNSNIVEYFGDQVHLPEITYIR
jgi:hypothetical protein